MNINQENEQNKSTTSAHMLVADSGEYNQAHSGQKSNYSITGAESWYKVSLGNDESSNNGYSNNGYVHGYQYSDEGEVKTKDGNETEEVVKTPQDGAYFPICLCQVSPKLQALVVKIVRLQEDINLALFELDSISNRCDTLTQFLGSKQRRNLRMVEIQFTDFNNYINCNAAINNLNDWSEKYALINFKCLPLVKKINNLKIQVTCCLEQGVHHCSKGTIDWRHNESRIQLVNKLKKYILKLRGEIEVCRHGCI